MPIVPGLTSGRRALFGGCGLGAAIEVMEQVTGRPCVWATAQYLSYASPPSVLELDATEVVRGHRISQARVIAHVGDTEVLTVLGALGERPLPDVGQWAIRPDVPPPDECPPRPHMNNFEDTIRSRLDERMAAGRPFFELDGTEGNGTSAIWVRLPELLEMSAAALAIIGDFVPVGDRPGARQTGRRQQPRQHPARRAPGADRLGARRHPRARGRRRLRPRPRAPVGGRRHAARHREPVHDRALVGRRKRHERMNG